MTLVAIYGVVFVFAGCVALARGWRRGLWYRDWLVVRSHCPFDMAAVGFAFGVLLVLGGYLFPSKPVAAYSWLLISVGLAPLLTLRLVRMEAGLAGELWLCSTSVTPAQRVGAQLCVSWVYGVALWLPAVLVYGWYVLPESAWLQWWRWGAVVVLPCSAAALAVSIAFAWWLRRPVVALVVTWSALGLWLVMGELAGAGRGLDLAPPLLAYLHAFGGLNIVELFGSTDSGPLAFGVLAIGSALALLVASTSLAGRREAYAGHSVDVVVVVVAAFVVCPFWFALAGSAVLVGVWLARCLRCGWQRWIREVVSATGLLAGVAITAILLVMLYNEHFAELDLHARSPALDLVPVSETMQVPIGFLWLLFAVGYGCGFCVRFCARRVGA